MRRIILFLSLFFIHNISIAQKKYWQQRTDYNIDVVLDTATSSIDGTIQINYVNNSPDTLKFIWFHLWPNAYKNDRTAFSEQFLENGNLGFYFSSEEKKGYINKVNFTSNGVQAPLLQDSIYGDIFKLILPSPLYPGDSVDLKSNFHVKLNYAFSRGGYAKKTFQLTQWYPKPAVYDSKGWHPMPYIDQGEFYGEFGNYNVTMTIPKNFTIASTGVRTNKIINDNSVTATYKQNNVHDFAWFTSGEYIIEHDTLQLASKTIDVFIYYYPEHAAYWKNALFYTKRSILTKSKWVGEYPYNVITVVDSKINSGGGMEYPTITILDAMPNPKDMDALINHEVGHNWFYGILASNERMHPWMDEGMNTYYDNKYIKEFYSNKGKGFWQKKIPDSLERVLLATMIKLKKDQPIETPAAEFNKYNYSFVSYEKAAMWMELLEKEIGSETFNNVMHSYFNEWKFKHPYPEDFKNIAENVSGKNLDSIFALLKQKGNLEATPHKKLKPDFIFNFSNTLKYNYLFAAPALGYNYYDKLMAGIFIHNYTLPLPKFKYFVAPMYGTGSRKFLGLANIEFTHSNNSGSALKLKAAFSSFNMFQYKEENGKKTNLRFTKLAPAIEYVFAEKPRSSMYKAVRFKTFFITEDELRFKFDSASSNYNLSVPKSKYYINRFEAIIENNRKLYPYNGLIQIDQGDHFIKAGFTGNYFFNFPKGGGLNVRLYAGKFIYTSDKTSLAGFKTGRYHLNLTGANGYEDYTYSDYFIGRNEFEGFASQQIQIRDGGFKVRTDLLSNKIGRSDDWLTALNFTSSIPNKISPLALLPASIPLKLFADVGTWNDNEKIKILYDAGLQLSFLNVIDIYIPLIYSKVYDDYFKSTITEKRFLKKISFSISFSNLKLRKFLVQSPL